MILCFNKQNVNLHVWITQAHVIAYGKRAASYTQHWPNSRETLVLQHNLTQAIDTSSRIFSQECNLHAIITIIWPKTLTFISSKPYFQPNPSDPMYNVKWPHLNTRELLSPPGRRWTTAWLFFHSVYEEQSSCKEKASRLVFGKSYHSTHRPFVSKEDLSIVRCEHTIICWCLQGQYWRYTLYGKDQEGSWVVCSCYKSMLTFNCLSVNIS